MNAVTEHLLVLHGDVPVTGQVVNETWILDLPSLSWKRYDWQYKPGWDYPRFCHTGTSGINSSVVIIGGVNYVSNIREHLRWVYYNDTFSVSLEPKSLQQLTTWALHKHRNDLRWKLLPKKLVARFQFPAIDELAAE